MNAVVDCEDGARVAFARLAVALFLSDIGLITWTKLPTSARRGFALAHGIKAEEFAEADRLIARFAIDEADLERAHRCSTLDALLAGNALPALPTLEPAP